MHAGIFRICESCLTKHSKCLWDCPSVNFVQKHQLCLCLHQHDTTLCDAHTRMTILVSLIWFSSSQNINQIDWTSTCDKHVTDKLQSSCISTTKTACICCSCNWVSRLFFTWFTSGRSHALNLHGNCIVCLHQCFVFIFFNAFSQVTEIRHLILPQKQHCCLVKSCLQCTRSSQLDDQKLLEPWFCSDHFSDTITRT